MDCNDPRCPIHGQVKTRGAYLSGLVVSSKAKKTAIVKITTLYTLTSTRGT